MTITNAKTPTRTAGLLTTLRDLGRTPARPMSAMRRTTAAQANVVKHALTSPVQQIPARISTLIPNIIVEIVADLPVSGITYWAHHRWHIHVREADPADTQAFTALHQLKHIIDHPLRQQQPTAFTEAEWETLADHFAHSVLAHIPGPTPASTENRKEAHL